MQQVSPAKQQVKINLKDFWHDDSVEAIRSNPFVKLLSERFTLRLSNDPDFLIYSDYGRAHEDYECVRIYWTGENHRPNMKDCDYAFSFDYSTHPRHFRLPNFVFFVYAAGERLLAPRDPQRLLRQKTRFCNFIVSHPGCPDRENFYRLLSAYKPIDAPGRVFNNMPQLDHSGHWFRDKVEFMTHYKFSIVFENSSHPGYTTEKLINAMLADSLGIYWGNPWMSRDFNTGSFINCHDFEDFDSVVEHVKEIDSDDQMYKRYLAEPFFNGNGLRPDITRENILDTFEEIFRRHSP